MSVTDRVRSFWKQPTRRYRNFQIVYSVLTANFAIPAVSYYVDPDATVERARQIGALLGEPDLPKSEDSYIWWVLGAGNVATLATICAFMQADLRRNRPLLEPLLVLKGLSSVGYFFVWRRTRHPFFASASALDAVTCCAMAYFALRAYEELCEADKASDASLEAADPSLADERLAASV